MKESPLSPQVHLSDLVTRYPVLGACGSAIWDAYICIAECYGKHRGKLLLCGNGGSAADGEHMAAELLKSFRMDRPVESPNGLSAEIARELEGALPAIPLSAFSAFHTAFANDRCGDFSFAQQVFALARKNDVLFCISTSGNSKNLLHASKTAQAMGARVIGLTGLSGGRLKSHCDICICVPESVTHRVQELHLPIYHALCAMIESHMFA
ncbi:MAG: SIS domain-containing protein [Puniceicoccales bacterium]|jgi:D-sedoheptulose 7-phosphate isomerase|nr:SIS domain-containing protein [Puniceicoccales bacterium]